MNHTDNGKNEGIEQLIEDPAGIAKILDTAREYGWKLKFCLVNELLVSPFATEILHFDREQGTITVGAEINTLWSQPDSVLRFNAHDGGLSIQFDAPLLPLTGNPMATKFATERTLAAPSKIIYRQKRKAMRVNFADQQNFSIILFTDQGDPVSGRVEDMSTSGVKARFPGYLIEQFEESKVIADCGLLLPEGTRVKARVEVLGTIYDFEQDATLIRCQFMELDSNADLQIKELIQQVLESSEQRSVVGLL
jgi:hypothetical protein